MNSTAPSPRWLGILLAVASAIGLIAATALTVDKLALLQNPHAATSCDVSPLVSCSKGLESWQGSLLGFPNSIIGMSAWSALLIVSLILLTGAHLSGWFWLGLNIALAGAFVLVAFLIGQSIYVLGILCPWCMATWLVAIPSFLGVSLFNLSRWGTGERARALGRLGVRWLPTITLCCIVLIALLAQARLDLLASL